MCCTQTIKGKLFKKLFGVKKYQIDITMNGCKSKKEFSIEGGLKHLENILDTNTSPFSSDCFGKDRGNLYPNKEFIYEKCGEQFNQYILLELLHENMPHTFRTKLIRNIYPKSIDVINFFRKPGDFPDDPETTAFCYKALLKANAITENRLEHITERMFGNVNDDGVIKMFFVEKGHERYDRIDATSICNILDYVYAIRQEHRVVATEDYVFNWLNSGSFKQGTHYYPSVRSFFYFCSVFAKSNHRVRQKFIPLLRQCSKDNKEELKFPLDFALEILIRKNIGDERANDELVDNLLKLQNSDGSWPSDALYYANKSKTYFGSKEISTMFAVAAIIASED